NIHMMFNKSTDIMRIIILRNCISGSVIKERLTPALNNYIRQLSGMGNNLNQIARKANREGYSPIRNEYLYLAEKIDNIIDLIGDDGEDSKR
ncbi:MAG: MobC family plasmid mobilization relaxosome protein, partial [Tannerellaceae bacterium]|nr:MobC family plasmid mobilization relaxosome protein [Tannerellaceae bacterium]